ncbi:MAG: FtsX-like permease family protein [Chloroflexota bacterium]
MRGLIPLAWRSLAARRLRSLLTIAGIALGVGVLFASLATNTAIDRSIDRTVRDLVGAADLRVSSFDDAGLSPASVSAIRSALGVGVAAPQIERRSYLVREADTTTGTPDPAPLSAPVAVLGIDPVVDAEIHDYHVVQGSPPLRRDEAAAVVSERLAHDDGYPLGAEITLQGAGDPERFRVVGIVAGDGPLVGAEGRIVILPIAAATRIFGTEGVTRVDVKVAGGSSIAEVESELESSLTADPYVLSSPRDLATSLRASTADFQSTAALIAAVALFVGAFLIFNTMSMTVAERVREVGLLRAAGATRRQVIGFVLAGAAALGVVGSIAGLIVGLVLAAAASAYVRTVGSVRIEGLDASPRTFVLATLVGVAVTVAAALEPAWRAGRISPVEALSPRAAAGGGQGARLRWLVVVFAAVGVVVLLAWPFVAADGGLARAFGVYAVLLVATLLSPLVLAPLSRVAGIPFAAALRFEERLARASLIRDRSRMALTVGALTIGLAMIVAIGGVASNARQAAAGWIQGVVPGDEVVTSIRPVALDEPVVSDLRGVEGVARVTPVATFEAAWHGSRIDAAAVVGADLLADGRLRLVAGDRNEALAALDAGGAAIVPAASAARLGVHVGDSLDFTVRGGTVRLRVAGIAERTLPGRAGETVLMGWRDATASFGVAGADFFAVRFQPGTGGAARTRLEDVARENALEPASLDRVEGAIADALGRVFGLFDALALIAVLVAALGIVNTLTMNVVERVREIGVLRATGMTRRQVGRMVVVEAGVLGLVGALLGIVTGLVVGGLMLVLGGGRLDLPLQPPWSAIGVCLVLGVGVSMAAAWYPARLAGRLSIVRAVQFE